MQGGDFVLSSPLGTQRRAILRRHGTATASSPSEEPPSYPRLSMLPISGLIRTRSSRMRFSEVVSFASGGDEPFTSSGTNWVCVLGRYVSAPGFDPDLLFVFIFIVVRFRNSVRLARFSGPDTPECTTFVPDSAGKGNGTSGSRPSKTFGPECPAPHRYIGDGQKRHISRLELTTIK